MDEEKQEEQGPKKMSTKQFWIRFAIWTVIAVLTPIGFLFYRYDMFVKVHTTESDSYSITGWGIFACIIVAIFLLYVVREAKKGLPYGSMFSQCIDGYSLLIPMVIVILILDSIKDSIAAFEQVMIVLTVCEAVAVPINPMRRWAWEHNIEMKGHFLTDVISKALSKNNTDSKK